MEKWTIEKLEKTDDLDFAIAILNERGHKLNPDSPLAKKCADTVKALADLKILKAETERQKKREHRTGSAVTVYYEKYWGDYHRKHETKTFSSLDALADWIFGQMKQNYSDPERGSYVMSFPTPAKAARIRSDAPWRIEFRPESGGCELWIHQITEGGSIIFSDGSMTAGQKHWSKEAREWCEACDKRQFAPRFQFAD